MINKVKEFTEKHEKIRKSSLNSAKLKELIVKLQEQKIESEAEMREAVK